MPDRIRIAVVDDHPLFRAGVAHILAAESDINVVALGGTADEAVKIARDELPDIILLDVNMPGSGIEAAKTISETCPAVKVVMVTVAEEEPTVTASLRAGARGYVLKGTSGPELVRTMRVIYGGEEYVTPRLAARLLADFRAASASASPTEAVDPLSVLTSREEQILRLVADGKSNKEVGLALKISDKTVKHYMTNILQKLRVRNRVEAALLARGIAREVACAGMPELGAEAEADTTKH